MWFRYNLAAMAWFLVSVIFFSLGRLCLFFWSSPDYCEFLSKPFNIEMPAVNNNLPFNGTLFFCWLALEEQHEQARNLKKGRSRQKKDEILAKPIQMESNTGI